MQLVAEALAQARRRIAISALIAGAADTGVCVIILFALQRVFGGPGRAPVWALVIVAATLFVPLTYLECVLRSHSRAFLAKQIDQDNGLDDLFVTVSSLRSAPTAFERACVRRLDAFASARPLRLARPRIERGAAIVITGMFACVLCAVEWREHALSPSAMFASAAAPADETPPAMPPQTAGAEPGSPSASAPSVATPPLPRTPSSAAPSATRSGPAAHLAPHDPASPAIGEPGSDAPSAVLGSKKAPGKRAQQGGAGDDEPGTGPGPGDQPGPPPTGGDPERAITGSDLSLQARKWLNAPAGILMRAVLEQAPGAADALRVRLVVENSSMEQQVMREEIPAGYATSIARYFTSLRQ